MLLLCEITYLEVIKTDQGKATACTVFPCLVLGGVGLWGGRTWVSSSRHPGPSISSHGGFEGKALIERFRTSAATPKVPGAHHARQQQSIVRRIVAAIIIVLSAAGDTLEVAYLQAI